MSTLAQVDPGFWALAGIIATAFCGFIGTALGFLYTWMKDERTRRWEREDRAIGFRRKDDKSDAPGT